MDRRCKDLRELTVQKEQELQSLREHHANQLEEALKDARSEITAERKKFGDLRNDFEYNLRLLQQRDEELGRYDTAFAELRQTVQNLVAENSELKITIDRLGHEVSTHKDKEQQLKNDYLQRIEEHRHQLDAYRQVKDREVAGDRAECARLQKELRAKLVGVQGELGVERERMEAQYDCLLRRQEGELRARVAELTTSLVDREGQVRELGKELQALKTAAECARREAEEKAEEAAKVEQGRRSKERELLEQLGAQGLELVDVKTRLSSSESRAKALQGEAARKLAELDRDLREKDRALMATKEAYHNLECDMKQVADTFRRQLEEAVETSRKEQEVYLVAMEDKRLEAERLERQLLQDRQAAEMREAGLVKEGVAKDTQLKALQEMVSKLQAQLSSQDDHVERFKRDLMLWTEREATLQQGKVQAELDWGRKLEEAERKAYTRHEDLIAQLSRSRDKAAAECKQLQMEVNGQAEVLKQVQLERDTAVAALEKPRHGYQTSSQGDFSELEQKNRELKAVIQEMRKEMEQCVRASDAPMRAGHAPLGVMDAPYSAEYVGYLEKELAEMKAEKRKMAEHLEELGAHRKPPTPPPPPPPPPSQSPARTSSSDWRHRTHLIALSDTIATLQREKCALELEVMRLKGREEQLLGVARLCQEELHRAKALSVPPSKVHHKLLRATQVIIALVREKESLLSEARWLKTELQELHLQLAHHRDTAVPLCPPHAGAPPTATPLPRAGAPPTATPLPQGGAPPTATPLPHAGAPPTATPLLQGCAPPTTLPQLRPLQPVTAAEVLIGAPPTDSTRIDAPPIILAPPTTAPPPHHQPIPLLPPPTHHSSPLPPLNESSDFDQQHDNLERLLCCLSNEDSHAPPSSCKSSPRHTVVPHAAPPPQGEEGMGVCGVGVRPLAKHTANTTTSARAPTKLQARRLGQNKAVKVRNYTNKS